MGLQFETKEKVSYQDVTKQQNWTGLNGKILSSRNIIFEQNDGGHFRFVQSLLRIMYNLQQAESPTTSSWTNWSQRLLDSRLTNYRFITSYFDTSFIESQ
jgi:hypothetical protein